MPALENVFVQASLFGDSSAVFSECGKYRYRLDRVWDSSLPPLAFGMLNPSTADHEHNDPTIERCERRAKLLGFGSLIVWNLFAYRATNPKLLKKQFDPVGPQNDVFICEMLLETRKRDGTVIVGWGSNGNLLERHTIMAELARSLCIELYCLGTTNDGQPKHPLYMPYQSKLRRWSSMGSA